MNMYNLMEAEWVWMIPAMSLSAFVIIVLFGRYLPNKGSIISVGAVGVGLILSCLVLMYFVYDDFVHV